MRVFLDIGAHTGETLRVVTDKKWGFERIYAFEPAPGCWSQLDALADHRVQVMRFGLWDKAATLPLFAEGSVGASMSSDKANAEGGGVECEFRDAADWFSEYLSAGDEVFAKINVEGAEAEIVRRLFESGHLKDIDHLLIHLDVRKVPSKRHLEVEIRGFLDAGGVQYQTADEIMFGGVYRGTANWLKWVQANPKTRDLRYKKLRRMEHAVRLRLYPLKVLLRRELRTKST